MLSISKAETISQLTSPGQFIYPATTLNFDDAPGGTFVNDRYLNQGIQFSRGGGQALLINYVDSGKDTSSPPNVISTKAHTYQGQHYTYTTYLDVIFSQPTFEIGAFFGNDEQGFDFNKITLSVFNKNNVLLGSVWVNANMNPNVDQFVGLRSDVEFWRAEFQNNGEDRCVILDDMSFSVPEPAMLLLLGFGSILLQRREKNGKNL